MAELRILRLFGNPLEFLPEILPLHKLRHFSLANIRIVADEHLRSVTVQIEVLSCPFIQQYFLHIFFLFLFVFLTHQNSKYENCHGMDADGEQFLFCRF